MKIYFALLKVLFMCGFCQAQSDPIAIYTNAYSNDFSITTLNQEVLVVNQKLYQALLNLGYVIVERENISRIISDIEDQKREDYIDGKTIKTKLRGSKYIVFADVLKIDGQTIIYITFTDLFQESILHFDIVTAGNSLTNFELPDTFLKFITSFKKDEYFYYSNDSKKTIKLLSTEKTHLPLGTIIYAYDKKTKTLAFSLKKEEELSSNIFFATITSKNKPSGIIDFNSFTYSPSIEFYSKIKLANSIIINSKTFKTIKDYYSVLNSLKNLASYEIEDDIHKNVLNFEKEIQKSDYFLNGISYYKEKSFRENQYEILNEQNTGNYSIFLNSKKHLVVNLIDLTKNFK